MRDRIEGAIFQGYDNARHFLTANLTCNTVNPIRRAYALAIECGSIER
jgi:hypothetical protein